jgi:segregation and condensation protein B
VNDDELPESLAAQAASWVPPWERQHRPPDRAYQAEAEEAARAEAEAAARLGVEGRDFAEAEELAAADDLVDADDAEVDEISADESDEPFAHPDDDEDRSAAGLSDDDDDFDEAFEGANPPGYEASDDEEASENLGGPDARESAAFSDESDESDDAVGVDSPAWIDDPANEPEPEPSAAELGPELPLPEAIEEAAEEAAEGDGEPADAPLPVDEDEAQPPTQAEAGSIVDRGRAKSGSAVPEQGRRRRDDADAVGEPETRTGEGSEFSTQRDVPTQSAPSAEDGQDALFGRSEAGELPDLMEDAELAAALEAILLVVDEPVAEMQLAQILEQPTERVGAMLEDISARYTAAGHGFDLRRVAGGWRLYTRPEYAAYVERFVLDGQSVRLTQAALETLAVVAYKQPVTRSRISAIRGVNCDGVMRTLVTRGLIEECGTEGETGAYLYRTTALFLEKLGLNSVDQLPPLAPFLPDDVEEVLDAPG